MMMTTSMMMKKMTMQKVTLQINLIIDVPVT